MVPPSAVNARPILIFRKHQFQNYVDYSFPGGQLFSAQLSACRRARSSKDLRQERSSDRRLKEFKDRKREVGMQHSWIICDRAVLFRAIARSKIVPNVLRKQEELVFMCYFWLG